MNIKNWTDAGNWDNPGNLVLTSLRLRFEAIRQAVLERRVILNRPGGNTAIQQPFFTFMTPAAAIGILTPMIIDLIPHFQAVRDNTVQTVILEQDSTAQTFQNISLADGSAALPTATGSLELTFEDGAGTFRIIEECYVDDLKNTAGVLKIQSFSENAILEEFPIETNKFYTVGQWIWNAYSILKLLTHPDNEIYLGAINRQTSERQWKRVWTYAAGTTYFYQVNNGAITSSTTRPNDDTLWNNAAWGIGDEYQSYARYTQTLSSGESTRESVRNRVQSNGVNNSRMFDRRTGIYTSIPVEMLYQKKFLPYNSGDTYIYDGYSSGQWIDLHSGTLNADETFDSSGSSAASRPYGAGIGTYSNADGTRYRKIACTLDMTDTHGLKFI